MRWLMERIKTNLKAALGLVRGAKEDMVQGQDRLDRAEETVRETMQLLDARKRTLALDAQSEPKVKVPRSKDR